MTESTAFRWMLVFTALDISAFPGLLRVVFLPLLYHYAKALYFAIVIG
jgi:hypothetical protein